MENMLPQIWEFECEPKIRLQGDEIAYHVILDGEVIRFPNRVLRFHVVAEDEQTALVKSFTRLGNTQYDISSVRITPVP